MTGAHTEKTQQSPERNRRSEHSVLSIATVPAEGLSPRSGFHYNTAMFVWKGPHGGGRV